MFGDAKMTTALLDRFKHHTAQVRRQDSSVRV
jgi:IstB-like ATP binding protein